MSYTDGIGNLQQIINSLATPETRASQQTNSTQETAATSHATNPAIPLAVQKTDQASLSATSNAIAQALSTPGADSDVRTEKIAALQQAIASGTYNVSSSDVADKLIQSLLK